MIFKKKASINTYIKLASKMQRYTDILNNINGGRDE